MIPFIRSLEELKVITESRIYENNKSYITEHNNYCEDSGQRKRYMRFKEEKEINLPALPKITRRRWIKSTKAVYKFLNDLDYNNQIQSSYDLTLIARQSKIDEMDAA